MYGWIYVYREIRTEMSSSSSTTTTTNHQQLPIINIITILTGNNTALAITPILISFRHITKLVTLLPINIYNVTR